uniref:Neuroguidin, EIF4E binding protein n=1 Tax=Erpetoichthys calabaricus TaxID=27687 RepID=A0A8C4RF65_ERPCA
MQTLVEQDLPEAVKLLTNMTEQVAAVTSHIQHLIRLVQNKAFQTAKGLSFHEVRYHLLLSYLQDLTQVLLRKIEGQSLKDASEIMRLVEIRTVLEKMRPIDQKLKYQVDKLVRTAVTGKLATDDPLHFKPRPELLQSKLSESEGESADEAHKSEKSGDQSATGKKYIPPRLAPMHYDGDQTDADRNKQILDRAKKRALSSSVIRELREQYGDAPEEIQERHIFGSIRQSQEEQHRLQYEESMMVRIGVSKKERSARKRGMMGMSSQLRSITQFGDIGALTGQDKSDLGFGNPKPKKKKHNSKKKKSKGFRK